MSGCFTVRRVTTASDKFIALPVGAQALYFHLCGFERDGYIYNLKAVMRSLNASENDLKILFDNGYLEAFSEGVYELKG